MHWNLAREDNRRVLKRIVALLFAFASLAERSSTKHGLLRASVLWILRSAETIVRDFVMDTALERGASIASDPFFIPALHGGNHPADAMRLAESFRALAVLLNRLADANPGRGGMCIAGRSIAVAACAADWHLPPATRFGRRQPCLVAPGFATERRDSS